MKRVLFCLVIFSCAGCMDTSQIEESTLIYDDDQFQRFVQILDEKGVKYSKYGANQVFYYISERDEVEAAKEEIFSSINRNVTGISIRDDQREPFVNALHQEDIPHTVMEVDQGDFTITWSAKNNEKAMVIVDRVMRENNW